ncbi:MAG: hypothetical protein WD472_08020 [Dehalococcoidia bacterium]
MHPYLDSVARTLGVPVDPVRLELQRAIRRSEPDAREEYAVIRGVRMVGRRVVTGDWVVSLEARRQPWEVEGG